MKDASQKELWLKKVCGYVGLRYLTTEEAAQELENNKIKLRQRVAKIVLPSKERTPPDVWEELNQAYSELSELIDNVATNPQLLVTEDTIESFEDDVSEVESANDERESEAKELSKDERLSTTRDDDIAEIDWVPVIEAQARVHKALSSPWTDDNLANVRDTLLNAIETSLSHVRQVIEERALRAEAIRSGDSRMSGERDVEATDEEWQAVTDARRKVVEALAQKPLTADVMLDAETRLLPDVESALDNMRVGIDERELAANQLRQHAAMTEVVMASPTDLTDLNNKRQAVKDKLLEAPLRNALQVAKDLLPDVQNALQELKKIMAERQKAADELLDAVGKPPLSEDPVGALSKQKQNLTTKRELVTQKLAVSPLTAEALSEAFKAHEELQKLLTGVNNAIAKFGGATKFGDLVSTLGESTIEALDTAFGTPHPEALTDLINDLGGKDGLTKLLGQYSPAELKGVCDDFGGAKSVEAILRVGCANDEGKMKSMLDSYSTTEKTQLKGLVEKGGLKPEVLGFAFSKSFDAATLAAKKQKAVGPPVTPLASVVLTTSEQQVANDQAIAQLKAFGNEFKNEADQKLLATLLESGGLNSPPGILGALLQTGCDGDANKLKTFVRAFPEGGTNTAQELSDLKGVVTTGGLGERPEVFASMLKTGCEGDAAKMKTFCAAFRTPSDQDKLRTLARCGLGGAPDESSDRLASAYKDGLGADPAKLKALHDIYNPVPQPNIDLAKLKTTMDGFDSQPPEPPPSQVGDRLNRVTRKLVTPNVVPPSFPQPTSLMKTQYFDQIVNGIPSGSARTTQDLIAREAKSQQAMTAAAKVQRLATTTANNETKDAVKAAQAAAEAAAVAALAGAPTNVDADAVSAAALRAAETSSKAAQMAINPAEVAAKALEVLKLEVSTTTTGLNPLEIVQQANQRAVQANEAAVLARDAASLAATDTDLKATAAALATASSTDIDAAKLASTDAAAKATTATDSAAKATDPEIVRTTLAAAAAAAAAAAKAAAAAAVKYAQANATTKRDNAKNTVTNAGTSPSARSTALDTSGKAELQAIIAADSNARSAAVKAAQAEALAQAKAADPNASPQEIESARNDAKLAATTAANQAAIAARTAVLAAVTAFSTPPSQDEIMQALAAADAATAAGLNASGSDGSNALAAANNAYTAAHTAAKNSATAPPPPANNTLPAKRLLAGAVYLQKVKANGGLHDATSAEPPANLEKMLRMGATMEKNSTAYITQVPSIDTLDSMGGNVVNDADLVHICGRHTREFFTFAAQELAPTSGIIEGLIMDGATNGLTNSQKTPQQKQKIKQAKKAKKTTFFPESISQSQIKTFVEEAVAEVMGGHPNEHGVTSIVAGRLIFNPPMAFEQFKTVPVNGGKFEVTIGLQDTGTNFKVTQLYPETGDGLESLNPSDLHALKSGLNF